MCFESKIHDQCALPVLTYGIETLTLTTKAANKIKVAQKKYGKIHDRYIPER